MTFELSSTEYWTVDPGATACGVVSAAPAVVGAELAADGADDGALFAATDGGTVPPSRGTIEKSAGASVPPGAVTALPPSPPPLHAAAVATTTIVARAPAHRRAAARPPVAPMVHTLLLA